MEDIAGEYRGLDRKSAYLSGMYRIGMVVQLIKRKGFERRRRNRSQWTGDDQNRFESRVVDLKATERFSFLNGMENSGPQVTISEHNEAQWT